MYTYPICPNMPGNPWFYWTCEQLYEEAAKEIIKLNYRFNDISEKCGIIMVDVLIEREIKESSIFDLVVERDQVK